MSLMHELEELVHDRLQELPMRLEEPWVLADNVHDVRRYDCLIVLATLNFAKTEKILDDGNQEAFLRFLIYTTHEQTVD